MVSSRPPKNVEISTVPSTHESHADPSTEEVIYKIEDVPPWRLSIVLGLQHYLTMLSGAVSVPYLIMPRLCINEEVDVVSQSLIISTTLFVSGIATFAQALFGNRLPIIQGPSLSFLIPTLAILSQPHMACPPQEVLANMTRNETNDMWQLRMREVQGAIMIASLVEVLVGLTGLIGFLMRWITPMAIAPTITLIGLDLFREAANRSSGHWGIAALTIVLLVAFSQYMANVNVPALTYSKKEGCHTKWFPVFKIFPVILTILISWGLCAILTATDVFPVGSKARTDLKIKALEETDWFRIPYPGQWGPPSFSVGPILGVLAGVMASTVESVGDYYACARLCGAPPPPVHAINRGIFMEGIGCILAGGFGTGCGLTSFSQNIGAIGITKVGSRRVIEYAAITIILFGALSKFGALFIAIPTPVMGGIFCVTFAIVTGVGLSNLQFVNLNCTRNLFILGFSIFMGLCIPNWLRENPNILQTGNEVADNVTEVLGILLKTSMFVGGFLGCLLDNTIPGSEHDRGIARWRAETSAAECNDAETAECYNFPFGMSFLAKIKCLRYVPISPTFDSKNLTLPCTRPKQPKAGNDPNEQTTSF